MKRSLSALVCASVAVLQADAMVNTATSRTSGNVSPSYTTSRDRKIMPQVDKDPLREAAGGEWDDDEIDFEVNSFQELVRSTGSEILDSKLQMEIDQATSKPDLFLDAHVSDASYMEKVAMASIPEQLPRPAVDALRKTKGLNYADSRVTPEEEIALARMIQRGAELHRLKSDFAEREGREPSRSEWTQLSGLESPRQLRREVANYRRAKQLLVSSNIGLVHAVVKSQYNLFRKSGISFDELVQEGSLGLLRAAELFDPNRGLRFSTYATIWIKGQLSNTHVAEPVYLPQRERTRWNKIVKAHQDLIQQSGHSSEPTVEELAEHLQMSVTDILATKRKMHAVGELFSLDYESNTQSRSGVESSSLNKLEGDKNFVADADLAERTQMHADVVAALADNLDAREARLMRLRYGLSDGRQRSLTECAEAMGISQSYAQNIASRCMKKLREASEVESLQEYLLTIA